MSVEASSGYRAVNSSDILSSGTVVANGLTPDGLMIYLQDRMSSIDSQANEAFEKQKSIESARKSLSSIQNGTAKIDSEKGGALEHPENVAAALKSLHEVDPIMAEEVAKSLGVTFYRAGETEPQSKTQVSEFTITAIPESLTKDELSGVKTTVDNYSKQLESSASLEMIQLQQVMSARQTAIQLSTNLISALGKGSEAIAANIGH